jgi:hypothetical protein
MVQDFHHEGAGLMSNLRMIPWDPFSFIYVASGL